MASGTTKERILQAAEEIMLAKSFHSVGLNEILSAVKVPKGSFYHYFSSKEQFGVELISHYVREHTLRLQNGFSAHNSSALQRFLDYWNYSIGLMSQGECRQACLVVKLSLEVTSFSEPMREVLAQGLTKWREIFEHALREGQADGSISKMLDPVETAAIIQDTWQGALQRAQVEKCVTPLRGAARFLKQWIEGK
jgi:TetR/AcrR family transcriptional repressor of nem operon